MKMFSYISSLVKSGTGNSSKSFALVMSTITSFIVTLFICGILSYDVYCNGFIKTDLESLAVFMLCIYAGVPSAGVPKIFGERVNKKVNKDGEEKEETVE